MADKPTKTSLEQMKKQSTPSTRWAAYQNVALDSYALGDLRFLATGPDHTYKKPPERYPDTPQLGVGWKFQFVGLVNLDTGLVEEKTCEA